MPPEIQKRIDQLYADMAPLMAELGMKPRTIEERYAEIQQRKAEEARILTSIRPKPKWMLK